MPNFHEWENSPFHPVRHCSQSDSKVQRYLLFAAPLVVYCFFAHVAVQARIGCFATLTISKIGLLNAG